MTINYVTAATLFRSWLNDVESGEPPVRFTLSEPFDSLDIRPGRLILFGGAPGAGKSAALLQMAIDLLRRHEEARLLIANVEMALPLLLERILSRLSGVPLSAISNRELSADDRSRIQAAVGILEPIAARLAFLQAPYSTEHLLHVCSEGAFAANIMILDYIQRFTFGDGKAEKREQLESVAATLRRVCDLGAAVLCAAAVSRQRDRNGSTYNGLGLASFRGSSELEYGADSAYLLAPGEGSLVTLRCEKNRYAEPLDIVTHFDKSIQTFWAEPTGVEAFNSATPAPQHTSEGGRLCND